MLLTESVGRERTDRLGSSSTIRKDKNDVAAARGIEMLLAQCEIYSQSHRYRHISHQNISSLKGNMWEKSNMKNKKMFK